MPLYEYECENCGKIEEIVQKFSDAPLRKCMHCFGKLRKLVSNSAFHLKGSGWYVTDYGNNSEKKSSSKSSPNTSESKSSSETTTASTKNT